MQIYEEFLESHREIIDRMHELYETDERFQQVYRDFEQQKICYIPIGYLVLKPLHRLLHYQLILESEFDIIYYFQNNDDVDNICLQNSWNITQRTTLIALIVRAPWSCCRAPQI